jgi:hypothetical protein
MRKLTSLQRAVLLRRLEREIAWHGLQQWQKDNAHVMAVNLVDGLEWTGVHGASEKRAVELIVARLEEPA